ncbi:MAG: hypothetical protein EOP50_19785 [Sphingobacteriales bacterium]|nr:MAG: hypothetical protein EOP50_19785 [Sphingobacteriales bacterium]
MKAVQYTIRGVPENVDTALREEAALCGKSLNSLIIEKLAGEAYPVGGVSKHSDLEGFAGCMPPDADLEEALAEQRRIDPADWE